MNEYEVRLHDNTRISVFAYSRADIGDVLERDGTSRDDVAGVRLIERKATAATVPFISADAYADAA